MTILHFLLSSLLLGACGGELVFAGVVARHGARQMENARYFNVTADDSLRRNPGRLTDVGKHQLHLLGRQLRYRYTKLLPLLSTSYQTNEVVFRSSGLNRTVESAQSFMSGFYHPGMGPTLRSKLINEAKPNLHVEDFLSITTELGTAALPYFMQPVAIHTSPEKQDYWFNAHTECASLAEDEKKFRDEFERIDRKYSHIYKLLKDKYGHHVNSAVEIYQFYDNLASVIGNYGNDSVRIDKEDIKLLADATLDQTLNMFLRSELKIKLMSHNILAEIKHHFAAAIAKHKDPKNRLKMAYLQMSDAHILALCKQLGIQLPKAVPFASTLIFELAVKSEGKYEVKVLYNGDYVKLKGKISTDYKEFDKYITESMFGSMDEFMDKCLNYPVIIQKPKLSTATLVVTVVIIAASILVLLIAFYFLCCRAKKPPADEVPEEEKGTEQYDNPLAGSELLINR